MRNSFLNPLYSFCYVTLMAFVLFHANTVRAGSYTMKADCYEVGCNVVFNYDLNNTMVYQALDNAIHLPGLTMNEAVGLSGYPISIGSDVTPSPYGQMGAIGGWYKGGISGQVTYKTKEKIKEGSQICINGGLLYENGWKDGGYDVCDAFAVVPPDPSPKCTINNGSNINVSFGQIDRSDILESGPTKNTLTKPFTISCTGDDSVDFSIALNSTPASWNSKAIQSSNTNVGVITTWNSTDFTNGTTQNLTVTNGTASANLSFTPVRPANVSSDNISTGDFTASATLIVTQQ